jgi:hypothetical protein
MHINLQDDHNNEQIFSTDVMECCNCKSTDSLNNWLDQNHCSSCGNEGENLHLRRKKNLLEGVPKCN